MDPDELIKLLDMLTPAEQDEIMGELNLTDADLYAMQGGGGAAIGGFDFGTGMPEFDLGTQDVMGLGNANYPEFTSKGALDPRDLTQIAKSYGLVGTQATRMVDPATLAMLGSDLGMFDPMAFEPSVTMPTQRLRSPGAEFLGSLAQGGSNTYEGYLAEMMLTNRMSPAAAVNQMMSDIRDATLPDADPDVRQRGQDLVDSLKAGGFDLESRAKAEGRAWEPSGDDEGPQFDVGGLTTLAAGWYKDLASDPVEGEGWTDPNTGIRYTEAPEVEPSAQAEWYTSRGIPLPTEQYTDPKFMEQIINAAAPTYGQEQADYERNITRAQGEAATAAQANRSAGMDLTELQKALESGVLDDVAPASWVSSLNPFNADPNAARPRSGAAPVGELTSPGLGAVTPSAGLDRVAFNELSPEAQLERLKRLGGQGVIDTIGTKAVPDYDEKIEPRPQQPYVPMFKGDQMIRGVIGAPGFNFGQFAGTQGEPLRRMRESDIEPARQRSRQATQRAQQAHTKVYEAGQASSPGILAGVEAAARARESAAWGHTPTRDAVMKRLMGLRMLTGT